MWESSSMKVSTALTWQSGREWVALEQVIKSNHVYFYMLRIDSSNNCLTTNVVTRPRM